MNLPIVSGAFADNWYKYIHRAAVTESIPRIVFGNDSEEVCILKTRLNHAAHGLHTEVEELISHTGAGNYAEELGDIAWYCAVIQNCFPNITFVGQATEQRTLTYWTGEVADIVKRFIYYNAPLDMDRLVKAVGQILARLATEYDILGHNLLDANIVKLRKRYPDLKFTSNHAIERDVAKEVEHFDRPNTKD